MIPFPHNSKHSEASSTAPTNAAEATLRLIAHLPAPEGLEDRVHDTLRSAPRAGLFLAWPTALRTDSNWMRCAAAAAIVFVVAGGGWGVYSRVQPGQPGKATPSNAIIAPPRVVGAGGFSSAGAMRTPQTLIGPVVAQPVTAPAAQPKAFKKPKPDSAPSHPAHPIADQQVGVQPDAPAAK